MTKAVILLAEGFEEIEALTVVDVLRRCNVEIDIAGVSGDVVEGAHGIKVITDIEIDDLKIEDYDALILPGGDPGYKNLRSDKRVITIVKSAFEKGMIVAAICAAPAVLADAGILKRKRATIYPGMENEIERSGAIVEKDIVVQDGNIVTSRGPATAIFFALKLGELLVGREIASDVGKRTLTHLIS